MAKEPIRRTVLGLPVVEMPGMDPSLFRLGDKTFALLPQGPTEVPTKAAEELIQKLLDQMAASGAVAFRTVTAAEMHRPTLPEATALRIQGIAAGLAELVRLHGSEVEAADVLHGMDLDAAALQRAGVDSYDLTVLLEVMRNNPRVTSTPEAARKHP